MNNHQAKVLPVTDHHVALIKSALMSMLALAPSVIAVVFLMQNRVPLYSPYLMACAVLILAAIDFATVIAIEPYRRKLSKITLPAFISAMAVVLMFVTLEAFNRFGAHIEYDILTPFVLAAVSLIYTSIVLEKNAVLKFHLSLNSIAIAFLWAMGSIDRITMPF